MDLIEKKWFEKELNGNDTLQRELNLRKRVDNALIQHDLISLRNKLSTLEKTRKEKVVASPGKKAIGIRFAAAIAALMVIGSLYLLTSGKSSPEALYNRYYEVYSLNSTPRSVSADPASELSAALELYSRKDFNGAAVIFRSYLSNKPEEMDVQLIYGVSEMENHNFPDAKSSFRKVIDHNDNLYIDKAQWYLALCSLGTGDSGEAIRQLDAILKSESIYKVKAKRLLRKIR
jgi:tetratricopeptide (TPR) repeat protein